MHCVVFMKKPHIPVVRYFLLKRQKYCTPSVEHERASTQNFTCKKGIYINIIKVNKSNGETLADRGSKHSLHCFRTLSCFILLFKLGVMRRKSISTNNSFKKYVAVLLLDVTPASLSLIGGNDREWACPSGVALTVGRGLGVVQEKIKKARTSATKTVNTHTKMPLGFTIDLFINLPYGLEPIQQISIFKNLSSEIKDAFYMRLTQC